MEFDITLNGYTGDAEIIPQNFLVITFCGEDPSVAAMPYQITDAEIGGKANAVITSDQTRRLYKRYDFKAEQGDMVYMVVTAYNDGQESTYWFEMQGPEPEEPVAASTEGATVEATATAAASDGSIDPDTALTIGSSGPEVKRLQNKLIGLGLLQGPADGKFGKYTASAVQIMQKKFGMEQTGIADAAFLERLYSDE